MRLSHTLLRQRRTPCFPQIDLTLRAILYEKRPRFLVLFSHQTTSYSQIFFTHPSYVPDEEIFYDYPTGCPNPCCTDDCEMIRFPRRGLETAPVLEVRVPRKRRSSNPSGKKWEKGCLHTKVRAREMCNWIDCDVCFGEETVNSSGSEGSESGHSEASEAAAGERRGSDTGAQPKLNLGQLCSKCKLVKYCSQEHQLKDWEEHKRVCVRTPA